MLFDLYFRNYATEGDADLNEPAWHERIDAVELRSAKRPPVTHDAGKARKPTAKRKDGISV